MSEKNSIKKQKQTKDKRSAKTLMGRVSKNNKKEIWQCVLYLRGNRADVLKLANWASLREGVSWSISQIRFTNFKTAMLSLQYSFRGSWCNFHREYEKKGGRQLCGCDYLGQTEVGKSIRLVRAVIDRI